ncbi:hypothetical protein BC2230_200039 [Burkholderia cepacia]
MRALVKFRRFAERPLFKYISNEFVRLDRVKVPSHRSVAIGELFELVTKRCRRSMASR